MSKNHVSPIEMGHFKFALIAPVIQGTFAEPSAAAYYRRVTANPLTIPGGETVKYQPKTLEKWTEYYRKGGIDAIMPKTRADKGSTRTLTDTAIEEIYRLKTKYPRLNATQIYYRLIEENFIPAKIGRAHV